VAFNVFVTCLSSIPDKQAYIAVDYSSKIMARFTALPSDTSEDDEKYVASPPRKSPPQPRARRAFPPSRVQRADEDAEMISDSGSSHADEKEEGDEEPPSDSSRLSADNQRASARAMTEDPEDEEEEESGESSRSSLEVVLPEHRRGDPTIIPWAQRLGIDPQKMHVMHSSLFPAPESAEALKQLNVEKHDRTHLTPNGVHRKHSRDSEGEGLRMATREVCPTFFFSSCKNWHFISSAFASGPPSPTISNPSLSVHLASMLEWRVPPPL
jgi:nuclear pore complex protein Nup98-Nup96